MPAISDDAYAYETEHVHEVYDKIAEHFSATRYKPWPIVSSFLKSLPPGSVGLDVGCGNGKYLPENTDVFIVGSDTSEALLKCAKEVTAAAKAGDTSSVKNSQPHQSINSLVVASTLSLPHPRSTFDFAISIAVVHHLSTRERRTDAVREILACLRRPSASGASSGRALLYVWALEQKSSRRGWDEGDQQDVMVPWVLAKKQSKAKQDDASATKAITDEPKTYQRYYHLYRKGELEADIVSAGGVVLDAGYEKDNWWAIAGRSAGDEQP